MLEKIIAALEIEDLSLAKQWMDTIDLQIEEGTPEGIDFARNDTFYILKAEAYFRMHDRTSMYESLLQGMENNPMNYEYYVLLSEYYYSENPNLSYLCLENALFHCPEDKPEDRNSIQSALNQLIADDYAVPKTSFIILSYQHPDLMQNCLESIRRTTPVSAREIVIVDNASTDDVVDYLKAQDDIVLIYNQENTGFPKGCNIGMEAATPGNDIYLLNNDTQLTENSLFWLRMGLYQSKKVGATGSVSNRISNYQNVLTPETPLEECLEFGRQNNRLLPDAYRKMPRLIGFSMLIKHSVLLEIGLLDENYTPGNYEDDDLSIRIQYAGYELYLCKNSFVYHVGSASFKNDNYQRILQRNRKYFINKWGISLETLSLKTYEHVSMTPFPQEARFQALEIGAKIGSTLQLLQEHFPHATFQGLDQEKRFSKLGKFFSPEITYIKETDDILPYPDSSFDIIYITEFLEFINFPEKFLREVKRILKPEGHLLFCIRNPRNIAYLSELLSGKRNAYLDVIQTDRCTPKLLRSEIEEQLQLADLKIQEVSLKENVLLEAGIDESIYQLIQAHMTYQDITELRIFQYFIHAQK